MAEVMVVSEDDLNPPEASVTITPRYPNPEKPTVCPNSLTCSPVPEGVEVQDVRADPEPGQSNLWPPAPLLSVEIFGQSVGREDRGHTALAYAPEDRAPEGRSTSRLQAWSFNQELPLKQMEATDRLE